MRRWYKSSQTAAHQAAVALEATADNLHAAPVIVARLTHLAWAVAAAGALAGALPAGHQAPVALLEDHLVATRALVVARGVRPALVVTQALVAAHLGAPRALAVTWALVAARLGAPRALAVSRALAVAHLQALQALVTLVAAQALAAPTTADIYILLRAIALI
jgi:hypothetical protein